MELILEWLGALLRWLHVMAGIAWVGTSFYFNWFDSLVRPVPENTNPQPLRPQNRGTLEEIHGGSFYYHEQYWPSQHPENLLRHSWPAKTTFITGIFLLATIYWVGASSYLVDKTVWDISSSTAILISFSSIALCWVIYRNLCKATDNNRIILFVMAILVLFACWGYFHVFGARAAILHVGAMMGSLMGLNVWFVIVPNHIAMTRQLAQGEKLNTHHGFLAKKVSQHNNYFSIPVVFTMVSNHFSFIYGHPYAWLILFMLLVVGWGIRHALNIHYKYNEKSNLIYLMIIGGLIMAIVISMIPRAQIANSGVISGVFNDEQAMKVVVERCATCHSAHPTQAGFNAPPQGMALENLSQVINSKTKIYQRLIVSRDMPIGNLTQMTEEERAMLGQWLLGKSP